MAQEMLPTKAPDVRSIMSGGGRLRTADWAFLAALVTLGAALRLYRLESPLWFDEIVTLLDSVRSPLREIVTHFPGNNDHPLYSVLARLSVMAFGESAWALRLPAVLFGIAAVPMLYVLGLAVADRREAAAASLILTVSYHHIWFSQNARAYTALLFFSLLSTLAVIRWFDNGRRLFLVVYALATAAGAYAHLTMVLVSFGQALAAGSDWLVYRRRSRLHDEWQALAAGFVGAAVLTLLMYAPMLADVGTFFTTQTAQENEVATPLWAVVAAIRGLELGFGLQWGIALGALVALAGAASYFFERPTVALLFLLPLPATVGLAVLVDRPIFPRFAFFAVGFALLVVIRGAAWCGDLLARQTSSSRRREQWRGVAVGLVAAAAVVLSVRSLPYGYRYPKQDYPRAVRALEDMIQPGDRVVVVGDPAAIPIQRYLGRAWQRIDTASDLQSVRSEGEPVWVAFTFPSYIQSGQPELWTILRDSCRELAEINGTVAGGSIRIARCP